MTSKVIVGEIKNRVGFEIDRRSWRQLDAFQKRLGQLKKQMNGLKGGMSLGLGGGGGSRGSGGGGGPRGVSSRRGFSNEVNWTIDAFQAKQKAIAKQRGDFLKSAIDQNTTGKLSGKSARDSAKVWEQQAIAEQKARDKIQKKWDQRRKRRIRTEGVSMKSMDLLAAFPKAKAKDVQNYRSAIDSLNTSYRLGKIDAQQYSQRVEHQNRVFSRQARSVKSLNQKFLDLRHSMIGIGIGGVGGAGAVSTGLIGIQFEAMNAKMLMATGSVEKAKSQMAFARAEATRLGHDILGTSNAFSKLSIATQGTLDDTQTRELFTGLMEMGTASKLTQDEMKRAINSIQQMSSKGQIMAEELKSQFAEAVPGGIQIFADALGLSKKELFAQMEAGKLLASDVLPKVAKQLSAVANRGGALAQALKSPYIQFVRMQNAMKDLADSVYKSGLNDLIVSFSNHFEDLFVAMKPVATFLMQTLSSAISVVTLPLNLMTAYLADLMELFGLSGDNNFLARILGIAVGVGVLVTAFKKLGFVFRLLLGLNPFGLIVMGVVSLISYWDEIMQGLRDSWNWVKSIFGGSDAKTAAKAPDTRSLGRSGRTSQASKTPMIQNTTVLQFDSSVFENVLKVRDGDRDDAFTNAIQSEVSR